MGKSMVSGQVNGDGENSNRGNRTNNVSGTVPIIPDTQSDMAQSVMVDNSIFNVCVPCLLLSLDYFVY